MAQRTCGDLRIRVTYLAHYGAGGHCPPNRSTRTNGEYRCYIRPRTLGPAEGVTVHVGAPLHWGRRVDCSEAYDAAARAALAFAQADGWPVETYAAIDDDEGNYLIGRR
jgi:hypothetical protein